MGLWRRGASYHGTLIATNLSGKTGPVFDRTENEAVLKKLVMSMRVRGRRPMRSGNEVLTLCRIFSRACLSQPGIQLHFLSPNLYLVAKIAL